VLGSLALANCVKKFVIERAARILEPVDTGKCVISGIATHVSWELSGNADRLTPRALSRQTNLWRPRAGFFHTDIVE
jgi:hypothetical protein